MQAIHPVRFAVVDRLPEAVDLGAGVGAAGVERRRLRLRRLDHLAEHLAAAGLVEAGGQAGVADGLQQVDRAQRVALDGVDRLVEAHPHVRLGAEVVDFVRLHAGQDLAQAGAVHQVAVVQEQAGVGAVRVDVQVLDPAGVERTAAADDAVDLVPLGEQELRQVGAVLTR